MNPTRSIRAGALLAAAAGLLAVQASAATAATADPVSSIRSAAQNTCLDVSTTNPATYFLDTYGHACNGSTPQAFAFHRMSSGPAGTFEVTSQATGKCMTPYRRGIRQSACTGSVPPDPTFYEWTLQRVGTTGSSYRFVETNTVGSAYAACVQVNPAPPGYPGPLFTIATCDANQPAQILTLATAL